MVKYFKLLKWTALFLNVYNHQKVLALWQRSLMTEPVRRQSGRSLHAEHYILLISPNVIDRRKYKIDHRLTDARIWHA